MLATLRRLLLLSAGAIALSASGLAQVSNSLQKTLSLHRDLDRCATTFAVPTRATTDCRPRLL